MQNNSPDKLLTRNEVEAEFGITRRYLELAAWRGDGPPMMRIGRRAVRYRRGDVITWIEQQRVAPGSVGRDR
jgi:predicted DNA-binding transcriptional regulator AlpA